MNVTARIESHTVPASFPRMPQSVAESGLTRNFLLDLMVKSIFRHGLERPSSIAEAMRISPVIVAELLEDAKEKALVVIIGDLGASLSSELSRKQ